MCKGARLSGLSGQNLPGHVACGRANAPGDAPYWRGAIWVPINYLAAAGLRAKMTQQDPLLRVPTPVPLKVPRSALCGMFLMMW